MNDVHIVDDDEAVRDSLSFLLSTAGYAPRTYASAEEFLQNLPDASPGCVITDLRMPGKSGIDLLREVGGMGCDLTFIVVTGHGDVANAVEAMKLGAADFLEKPYDERSMLSAIETACRNRRAADETRARRTAYRERLASLSHRESQVLEGVVAGRQNKEIALQLGISPRTVEVYRSNLMTKMQAGSLSELVRMSLLADNDV